MDKFDQQLKEIICQNKSENIPIDFYSKIDKKIEARKEQLNRRKEVLLQVFVMAILSLAFFGCMFFLNLYYFHVEVDALTAKPKDMLNHMSQMFNSNAFKQWSIVCVNALILILLEQFLSRKLSRKL